MEIKQGAAWDGWLILREAMRTERWICAGSAIRNGGTRRIDATLTEHGWTRAGRAVVERSVSNAGATMVFVPCFDRDDEDETVEWVVLLGAAELGMLPYNTFEEVAL